ncbi:MAG: DUF3737 family protein [Clostridia bacterium]|nr:DUF3737 family protein [Clostridia bacterium]
MTRICVQDQNFDAERSLYNLTHGDVLRCTFAGPADGESVLKEARDITADQCTFSLRYPLWHARDYRVTNSVMEETCRAPLWYTFDGVLDTCRINGVKCLRECDRTRLTECTVVSPEFGWKCRGLEIERCDITSEYLFWESRDISVNRLTMHGKYSFQYTENVHIRNSNLQTKDAFWHARNVLVEDSIVAGEYLGWFSEGLTLVRCRISGTQPLCYCKNLTLIDCTMAEDADLSFEYSDVKADVIGHIHSVKNPHTGHITADSIGEIILEDSIMETDCVITDKSKA